jgi:hypothetical protein
MAGTEDLWPSDFGTAFTTTPVELLKAQAQLLSQKTNNVLQADVKSEVDGEGDFLHSFDIVAPALKQYRYTLFEIWHGVHLYPVGVVGEKVRLDDESELKEFLRKKLSSDDCKRVVNSLLLQSRHSR